MGTLIEEDEMSDTDVEKPEVAEEEPKVTEQQETRVAPHSPDLFALVAQCTPRQIRVPGVDMCLDLDSAGQKELRKALVEAGGPLTKYMEETFFRRNKKHVNRVQDESRALARMRVVDAAILWLGGTPPFHNGLREAQHEREEMH